MRARLHGQTEDNNDGCGRSEISPEYEHLESMVMVRTMAFIRESHGANGSMHLVLLEVCDVIATIVI